MKIDIAKPDLFAAASYFVSTDETRYYLGGVAVQRHPSHGLYYVATDGHVLFMGYDCDAIAEDMPEPVILATEKGKPWAKTFFGNHSAEIRDDLATFTAHNGKTRKAFVSKIDGSFPDWQRVLPIIDAWDKEEPAYYNPDLLHRFSTVAWLMDSSPESLYIHQCGSGPAPVLFYGRDDCAGVIMPMRRVDIPTKHWPGGQAIQTNPGPLKAVA